jgi:hypothetical protein
MAPVASKLTRLFRTPFVPDGPPWKLRYQRSVVVCAEHTVVALRIVAVTNRTVPSVSNFCQSHQRYVSVCDGDCH